MKMNLDMYANGTVIVPRERYEDLVRHEVTIKMISNFVAQEESSFGDYNTLRTILGVPVKEDA